MNEEVKKVISPKPMISFRSARKLSSCLVRATLYPIEEKLDHLNVTKSAVKCAKC